MVIVAAPSYLSRFGEPKTIVDLEQHNRLGFGDVRAVDGWPLKKDAKTIAVPPVGRVQASDGQALRQLTLRGNGLARLAVYTVREDIAAGRLIPVLKDFNPGDHEAFMPSISVRAGPVPPASGHCSIFSRCGDGLSESLTSVPSQRL